MRLIATIGASSLDREHTYILANKAYRAGASFLALAEAYGIEDIVLVGTSQSQETLQDLLAEHPNITMVTIDSDDASEVFRVSLEHIDRETILDLTQGYRHYPMLTLLASIFLQGDRSTSIRQIYYAQITDNTCSPRKDSCRYRFVSLIHYLDIANMARIIHTFQSSLIVPDYDVSNATFASLRKDLEALSGALFSNHFERSKALTIQILPTIETLREDHTLSVMDGHLQLLQNELQTIHDLTRPKESKTLLNVSGYFLKKEILLHAVTLLHESMLAFLDEKIELDECTMYTDRRGQRRKANTFKRRSCLKRQIRHCDRFPQIPECQHFHKALRRIDELRNAAAHAYTSSSLDGNLDEEIRKQLKLIKRVIAS